MFTQIAELRNEADSLLKEKYGLKDELIKLNSEIEKLRDTNKQETQELNHKIKTQKEELDAKIAMYELIITDMLKEWEVHLNTAEKIILNKK